MIEPRRTEEEVEAMRSLQSLKGRMKKKEISHNLAAFVGMAVAVGIPKPEAEWYFHPKRSWRFDLAWPAYMIAFEREGGTWQGSRHTRGQGYRNDIEKYNEAGILGWQVIRATVDMMNSGEALNILLRSFAIA